MSRAPGDRHQYTCTRGASRVDRWNDESQLGVVLFAPRIVFTETDAVQPDLVWVSHARLAQIEGEDDHLHGAPELVVEVLSPGAKNEERDRDTKLRLYSRYGVEEYWLIDPRAQRVEVYRRHATSARRSPPLRRVAILGRDEVLTSPLLPGFALPVAQLFR